jgi:hypothetical protein
MVKKDKRPKTHVLVVLDGSGSMWSQAEDVRGGFNSFVDKLAGDGNRYRVTVTVFNTEFTSLAVASKIKDLPRLNQANYYPQGGTALLDAVGKTITEFEGSTKLEDGERVLVVVHTDGAENSSVEFNSGMIAQMIRKREKTDRWLFMYMGAGAEAWGQGQHLGFSTNLRSENSRTGTQSRYAGTYATTSAYAGGASGQEAVAVAAATPGLSLEKNDTTDESGAESA